MEEIKVASGGDDVDGEGESADFCVVTDETVIDCEGTGKQTSNECNGSVPP